MAAFTFLGNTGGIVSSNIFAEQFEPKYIVPLAITAGFEFLGLCLVIFLRVLMNLDNGKRNRAKGVKWQSKDVPAQAQY